MHVSEAASELPPLYLLRTFWQVATERSYTRAAASLYLSQPAVSGHIRTLERHYRARLFQVRSRRVYLTAEGEALLEYAERIFGLLREAEHAVAETRDLQRGQLTVAASTTIGIYLLPPVLQRYRTAYPGVRLVLLVGTSAETLARVVARDAPVGLVEAPVAHAAVDAQPFAQDELVLIVPPGHPWAGSSEVTSAELNGQPLLRREAGSGTRAIIDGALQRAGIAVTAAMELGSTEAIKQAVMAGLGAAWVSRATVAREVRSGTLAIVRTPGLDLTRSLFRLTLRGARLPRAAAAFGALLGERSDTAR